MLRDFDLLSVTARTFGLRFISTVKTHGGRWRGFRGFLVFCVPAFLNQRVLALIANQSQLSAPPV